jgi:hypothetical protein
MECLIGDSLRAVGYPVSTEHPSAGLHAKIMKAVYEPFFEAKLWLKSHTPLGRLANLDFLEIGKDGNTQELEARS